MHAKRKTGVILASLGAIAIAGSVIAGSTYALFTSESKTNIAIVAGKVSVLASINEGSLKTYSGVDLTGNVEDDEDRIQPTEILGTFTNGGTASISGNTLNLNRMVPGDKVTFDIVVKNESNVRVLYRTLLSYEDNGLFKGLNVTVGGEALSSNNLVTSYTKLEVGSDDIVIPVVIAFPTDAGNEYQEKKCDISFAVEAVQGNAATGTYHVTPANAQSILDTIGEYSTVVLEEGDYDTLYLRQSLKASTRRNDLDLDSSTYPAYYREFKNITIQAAEGATVTCKGIEAEAGLFHASTYPASNQEAMNRADSGFISYLSLEDVSIEGISFTDSTKTAIKLRDKYDVSYVNGSSLLVDGFTIKDSEGTGSASNSSVHFLEAGTGTSDAEFLDTGKKALNNITIEENELTDYVGPIYMDNGTAVLNGFTVTSNGFASCTGDVINVSNKEAHGNIIIKDNVTTNINGRFVLIENAKNDVSVTLSDNTVEYPVSYAADGTIAKVSGEAGFEVADSNNGWTVGDYTTSSKTIWQASGNTSDIKEYVTINGQKYTKEYETGFENLTTNRLVSDPNQASYKTINATAAECDGLSWKGYQAEWWKGNYARIILKTPYSGSPVCGYLMTTQNFTGEMDALQCDFTIQTGTATTMDVQYSLDDGSTWTTFGQLATPTGTKQFVLDHTITNCRIRFIVTGGFLYSTGTQNPLIDLDNISFLKKAA